MYLCVHTSHRTHVEVWGELAEVSSVIPSYGSWGLNQVTRLDNKCCYPLSHLTAPLEYKRYFSTTMLYKGSCFVIVRWGRPQLGGKALPRSDHRGWGCTQVRGAGQVEGMNSKQWVDFPRLFLGPHHFLSCKCGDPILFRLCSPLCYDEQLH